LCPSFNLDRVRAFIFFHRFAGGQLRPRRKSAPAHVAAAAAAAAATGMDLPAGPEFDRTVAHQLQGLALTGGYWTAAQTSHALGAATRCKGASCGKNIGAKKIMLATLGEIVFSARRFGRTFPHLKQAYPNGALVVCVRGVQPRLRSPPQPQTPAGRRQTSRCTTASTCG